jgi:hypothetical protein
MNTDTIPFDPRLPFTQALRQALPAFQNEMAAADLLFLERWEIEPLPGAASALRVTQIRRANPELAAAIRAELTAVQKSS